MAICLCTLIDLFLQLFYFFLKGASHEFSFVVGFPIHEIDLELKFFNLLLQCHDLFGASIQLIMDKGLTMNQTI